LSVAAFEVQPAARSLQPIAGAPQLTAVSSESMREISIVDETGEQRLIYIPSERPLTVLLEGRELVTLMTLGASPELLVLGFLLNQRLIDSAADIESIAVDWQPGTAAVERRANPARTIAGAPRAIASGQGSVFMRLMAQAESIRLPGAHETQIRRESLLQLLDVMRQHDIIHKLARSVHSCALFQDARLLVSVEDVSRHNALDTICGWMALHGIKGADSVLFTTGRLTGEIIIKAAQFGVPIMVSRNGVSAMGHDLAKKFGMTLIGRAVSRRYICYVGAERLDTA
jgi:FdhD protein